MGSPVQPSPGWFQLITSTAEAAGLSCSCRERLGCQQCGWAASDSPAPSSPMMRPPAWGPAWAPLSFPSQCPGASRGLLKDAISSPPPHCQASRLPCHRSLFLLPRCPGGTSSIGRYQASLAAVDIWGSCLPEPRRLEWHFHCPLRSYLSASSNLHHISRADPDPSFKGRCQT